MTAKQKRRNRYIIGGLIVGAGLLLAGTASADPGKTLIAPKTPPPTPPPKRPDIRVTPANPPRPTGPGGFATPEDPTKPDPAAIVDDYLGPGTRTGTLYQIKPGDNPTKIAARALGGEFGVSPGNVVIPVYVRAMCETWYNRMIYAVEWIRTQGAGPGALGQSGPSTVRRRYTCEGSQAGRIWYIGDAFFPKHFNNRARMREGQIPLRNTNAQTGARQDSDEGSFGLLWLPKVQAVLQQNPYLQIDDYNPPARLAALMPNVYG